MGKNVSKGGTSNSPKSIEIGSKCVNTVPSAVKTPVPPRTKK